MVEKSNNFTKRLLSQQSMDPGLQEQYRKELKKMLEVKIKGLRKAFSIAVATILYFVGLNFLYISIHTITMIDMFRYAFCIVGVTLIALSVLGVMTVIKGVFVFRTHGKISTAIIVYGFGGAALILLGHGLDVKPAYMVVAGFVLLGLAFLGMTLNLIKQAKLNARERELLQEYNKAGISPES